MAGKADQFISELDASTWNATLANYPNVIRQKAAKKTKKSSGKELLDLDKWFQETLPVEIMSRDNKYITHDDIVKLMTWKLSRGKFRPRLIEFAGSNSASDVEKLSHEAYDLVDSDKGNKMEKIEKAISLLSKLKGIGPATASAILSAGCPDKVAFMADEPTYLVLGDDAKLKYSLGEYMTYLKIVRDISSQLNKKDPDAGWNPHKVELAMWSHCLAKLLDLHLPDVITGATPNNNNSKETTAKNNSDEDVAPVKTSSKSSDKKRGGHGTASGETVPMKKKK